MLKGFKEFIAQGNVVDLAVAVVIGAAFGAIINAIVDVIISPLVALFYAEDGAAGIGFTMTSIYGDPVFFDIGALIAPIISFLSIALVVYLVFVNPMNKLKARREAKNPTAPEVTEKDLLVEIRDLLAKQNSNS